MISEDQKEAEIVKDSHIITLVVSIYMTYMYTVLYYGFLTGHLWIEDTSINRTLSSVSNATFVYLTTSEMRTPHYSGHSNLAL